MVASTSFAKAARPARSSLSRVAQAALSRQEVGKSEREKGTKRDERAISAAVPAARARAEVDKKVEIAENRAKESADQAGPPPAATAPESPAAFGFAAGAPSAPAAPTALDARRNMVIRAVAPVVQLLRDQDNWLLRANYPSAGYLYAFAEEGLGWKPLLKPGENRLLAGQRRDFSLGQATEGTEVRVLWLSLIHI